MGKSPPAPLLSHKNREILPHFRVVWEISTGQVCRGNEYENFTELFAFVSQFRSVRIENHFTSSTIR